METFGTASENINGLEAIANYSGIVDAGFELIPVEPSKLDTVGARPTLLLI
ncbi:MAG: hypothetical protein F6K50_54695 [Moorea sp. SIO3I7]|uniref:hypothetical protein n=1 Tax=Moorena sp. SIO4A1 TaxID=2607835 RepID=UPI0013BCA543|nr:hypothetical protein [Moorena sp. SIO4A1]NEO04014.1 hypothetical protein [Moorena sp. SIO3I7]NEO66920.1 hypothetical protein [Moorena sp. SIO4G2]NEQ84399.1 hypothetical protein [Moorena sp. SIO2I5]